MTNLLHDIIANLGRLDEDELVTLNRAVLQEFKHIRTRKANDVKATLTVGQPVEWSGRKGHQSGILHKINRKNAKVRVGNVEWTVPLTMLKAVA